MFIPNSKLDMPELLYPGRKPVGNVKIDWSHPLAKGLKRCFGFNNSYADLVSGEFPASTSGTEISRGVTSIDSSTNSAAVYTIDDSDQISVVVGFRLLSANDFAQIVGDRSSTGFSFSLRYKRALQVLLSGGSIGTADLPADGSYYNAGFTHTRTGNSVGVYKNGKLTDSGSISRSTSRDPFRIGNYDLNNAVQDNSYTYVYNRVLNSFEMQLLHDNPYRFLIPA